MHKIHQYIFNAVLLSLGSGEYSPPAAKLIYNLADRELNCTFSNVTSSCQMVLKVSVTTTHLDEHLINQSVTNIVNNLKSNLSTPVILFFASKW